MQQLAQEALGALHAAPEQQGSSGLGVSACGRGWPARRRAAELALAVDADRA